MDDAVFEKLAGVLDTLPNGFPATREGLEIRLLKKIFTPEQAELFCDLRLKFETPEQIARRTGRPLEGLAEQLREMWQRGQVSGIDFGTAQVYRMIPWVVGIWEFQVKSMDREFAELSQAYMPIYGRQFFSVGPQVMQVVPVEAEIRNRQQALPYQRVSAILENGKSFAVNQCICKKEKHLLDKGCDKPTEVCLAVAPLENYFNEDHPWGGRAISKQEAYEVLEKAEAAGLVHMASNTETEQYYICNCCGCCCAMLRGINELGIRDGVNAHYYAVIDPEKCEQCGICADERCQVNAISQTADGYVVAAERCIGCGLCVTTCPTQAVELLHKAPEDCTPPPADEKAWFRERAERRGVDCGRLG